MAAGAAVVIWVTPRPPEAPVARPVVHTYERPWLTREAANQILGDDGELGPLFADVSLGGSPPSPATRARIAAFAQAHDVDIDFEVVDDELTAVRFAVTFGGCCGYEGADTFARRIRRPKTSLCCACETAWIDDWAVVTELGVHVRTRVRVNRVEVRWEPTASLSELLDRAERLIGQDPARVRAHEGDRWSELDPGERFRLELPYPFSRSEDYGGPVKLRDRDDLGLQVDVEHGRIAQVSFLARDFDDRLELFKTLRARWGRPRIVDQEPETSMWQTHDRIITVVPDGRAIHVEIRGAADRKR